MMAATTWPCKPAAMHAAREFLRTAVRTGGRILLVPDRDADGLSAGSIVHRTLGLLGHQDVEASLFLQSGDQ